MEQRILEWLDTVGWTAFILSAVAFVAVNGFAIAMVVAKRDRELVNRWTARFLAANVLLLGTGVGVPLLTMAARFTVVATAPVVRTFIPPISGRDPPVAAEQRELRARP
jgi:hypothetical protein